MDQCEFCHVEHGVAVPCIHLNGSPAENLRDDLNAAAHAVETAIAAVVTAAPNGRDYYVLPGNAMLQVSREHEKRLKLLHDVRGQLVEMLDHVQAVIDFKEEQRRARRNAR